MFCIKKIWGLGESNTLGQGVEEPTVSSPSCPQSIFFLGVEMLPAVAGPTPLPLPCSCSPAAQPHPKDSWERLREGAGACPAAGFAWVGGGL